VLADPATHTVYAGDAFGGPVSFFRFQLPRRPTDVTATAHDAKTQLRWRPPYDGGLPVIYQVITTPTCPACHGLTTPAISGQPFTTITGLTPERPTPSRSKPPTPPAPAAPPPPPTLSGHEWPVSPARTMQTIQRTFDKLPATMVLAAPGTSAP